MIDPGSFDPHEEEGYLKDDSNSKMPKRPEVTKLDTHASHQPSYPPPPKKIPPADLPAPPTPDIRRELFPSPEKVGALDLNDNQHPCDYCGRILRSKGIPNDDTSNFVKILFCNFCNDLGWPGDD